MLSPATPRRLDVVLRLVAVLAAAATGVLGAGRAACADDVYVRSGPFYYCNGRDGKPTKAEVTNTSITSTDAQGRSNTISWDEPPAEITFGQEVTWTLHCTSNEGPPMIGSLHAESCDAQNAKLNEASVVSFKGGIGRPNYTEGRMIWAFKPTFTPRLAVQAGRYDDYSGEMSVRVWWEYKWVDTKDRPKGKINFGRLELADRMLSEDDGGTIEYRDAPLAGKVTVFNVDGPGVEAGIDVAVDFDGREVGKGTTDTGGDVKFSVPLSPDTPTGLVPHPVKVRLSKAGRESVERQFTLNVKRGLLPIVVEAAASTARVLAGESFTVTGRVYKYNYVTFNEPVKATITIVHVEAGRERVLAEVQTDDEGTFRATMVALPTDYPSLDVKARPTNSNRYDKGECTISFNGTKPKTVFISLITDKAVYSPNDTIRFIGTTKCEDKGVACEVRIKCSAKFGSAMPVTSLTSDDEGQFRGEFPVSKLVPPNTLGIGTIQSGHYVLGATASAIGYQQFTDALAYVTVSEPTPEGSLQEFQVTGLTGSSLVRVPALTPDSSWDSATPMVGAKYTQGAAITVSSNSSITLLLPMGPGSGVQLELGADTQVRIGTFYRAPDGRVKLRIFASEPATVKVRTINPGGEGAPLDYQIVTASAVVTSVKTEYTVRVAAGGATTVEATEGEVQVVPMDTAKPAFVVPAGEQASVERAPEVARDGPTPLVSRDAEIGNKDPNSLFDHPAKPDVRTGRLDPKDWATDAEGGTSLTISGDRLTLDVPKDSDGTAEAFMKAPLRGDFDVTIDYTLDQWRVAEETSYTLSLVLSPGEFFNDRQFVRVSRYADSEERDDHVSASASSDDADLEEGHRTVVERSGRLRAVRRGGQFEFSCWDGRTWQPAGTRNTQMPADVHLGVVLERQGATAVRATVRVGASGAP